MDRMFKLVYETRYSDYKDFDTIKASAVMDIVQDVAIQNSSTCGFGINNLRKNNYAWLLQGVTAHFEKKVVTGIPIEAETAIKGFRGVTSERGTILKQNGEVVAKTVANWFLFDTKNLKPARIPQEMAESYYCHNFEDEFFRYKKPKAMEIDTPSYTIKVSNRDIDTNMHLNNQKAMEILIDALPFDYYFNHMNIFYKRATYLGDELGVCIKETENGYYVHLETKEKELCVAGTFEYIE